jgi:protein gp37
MARRLKAMGQKKYRNEFAVTLHPECLNEPLHWRKPSMVFVCSMGDLFHNDVPSLFIDKVFTRTSISNQHVYQVLTKRADRMAEFFSHACNQVFLENKNLWLGTSAEDQPTLDDRVKHLLRIPAAVRFLSLEPLLGPIDIPPSVLEKIQWIIVGCESGPKRRPCDIEWIRSIVRQCQAAKVRVFVKQVSINGRVSHNPAEWPKDLQKQEWPK